MMRRWGTSIVLLALAVGCAMIYLLRGETATAVVLASLLVVAALALSPGRFRVR